MKQFVIINKQYLQIYSPPSKSAIFFFETYTFKFRNLYGVFGARVEGRTSVKLVAERFFFFHRLSLKTVIFLHRDHSLRKDRSSEEADAHAYPWNVCVVVRLTKYDVYEYIGCITDQSNWSGPFSLLVMTPDFDSDVAGSKPGRGTRLGIFLYRSIAPPTTFGVVTRMTTVRAQGRSCVYGVKSVWEQYDNVIIPKHLMQMIYYSMEECSSAASEERCI